jgi:hypothetical protein
MAADCPAGTSVAGGRCCSASARTSVGQAPRGQCYTHFEGSVWIMRTWTSKSPACRMFRASIPSCYWVGGETRAAGADQSYPLPKVAKRTRVLEGAIGFVDNEGIPVAGPPVAAVEAHAAEAEKLCVIFALQEISPKNWKSSTPVCPPSAYAWMPLHGC